MYEKYQEIKIRVYVLRHIIKSRLYTQYALREARCTIYLRCPPTLWLQTHVIYSAATWLQAQENS